MAEESELLLDETEPESVDSVVVDSVAVESVAVESVAVDSVLLDSVLLDVVSVVDVVPLVVEVEESSDAVVEVVR